MNKRSLRFLVLTFSFALLALGLTLNSFAQEPDLEFTLDINSETVPLPKIFRPGIDLSGRGFSRQSIWPQELAAAEVLDLWQKDLGFSGIYRIQYNLWEIEEFSKNKNLQSKLLNNYENIFQRITDAGGIVIVDIFGTPAGLGKVLDKRSPPLDLKTFKEIVKRHIRHLSCEKRYNIWYEAWTAPDLDDFFLGRRQDYLNLYRCVSEAILELERESKIHIPLGGPSSSWWFQSSEGNTIISPEKSLIYELIRFCFHYHLPLDFISWHSYSTDPKTEKSATSYNKTTAKLIRAWLSYFHFKNYIPLIIDEWNYDSGANILPARNEKANICASFIPARIKNMYEEGLTYQVYFSLEDFQSNKENVTSNVGAFWFDPESSEYKGHPKAIFNAFKMLSGLGDKMFTSVKLENEFVGAIATKEKDDLSILIYNYIDPDAAMNYLSRSIASLNSAEKKTLLDMINSSKFMKILNLETDTAQLRVTNKVRAMLEKARDLNTQVKKFKETPRPIQISLKNLKGNYLYQRYSIDSSCVANCKFSPVEEKEISAPELYQETLTLEPYSVDLLVLKIKPKEPTPSAQGAAAVQEPPKAEAAAPQAEAQGVQNNKPGK